MKRIIYTAVRHTCIVFFFFFVLIGCGSKENKDNIAKPKTGTKLDPQAFKSQLSATPDAILIDVRKPEELAEGFIDGAINIDYTDSSFSNKIRDLDKSKTYFVYCKSGKRTAGAVDQMERSGFENIFILEGGYMSWVEKGLETAEP
jgi:rhodanese-related sulfurtransferase